MDAMASEIEIVPGITTVKNHLTGCRGHLFGYQRPGKTHPSSGPVHSGACLRQHVNRLGKFLFICDTGCFQNG